MQAVPERGRKSESSTRRFSDDAGHYGCKRKSDQANSCGLVQANRSGMCLDTNTLWTLACSCNNGCPRGKWLCSLFLLEQRTNQDYKEVHQLSQQGPRTHSCVIQGQDGLQVHLLHSEWPDQSYDSLVFAGPAERRALFICGAIIWL